MKGAESYRVIHAALASTLCAEGHQVRLASRLESSGDSLCFLNPVDHDIVDAHGRKLAGAGQRRTKLGLLHQGSVALACEPDISVRRAMTLAAALSRTRERWDPQPPVEWIADKIKQRYACGSWINRR
jgi:lipoate-protein ligase A